MRTDRLTFDDRATFERTAFALTGLGLVGGGVGAALGRSWLDAPLMVCGLAAVALAAASTLRGKDDGLGFAPRLGLLVAAALVGQAFGHLTAMAVALGACAGLALAGPRRLLGLVAGTAGAAWVLAVMPQLDAVWGRWPLGARGLAVGMAVGILFAVPLLAAHVRVHADALSARLSDERLAKLWARIHAALAAAPSADRRALLGLLSSGVRRADERAGALRALDARLTVVGRKDAEDQLAQLKTDIADATDPTARARLEGAASSLADSLEALDGLQRKRERLEAELRLNVATLERAALSLETAQGEAGELRAVALRLQHEAAA